MAIIVRCWEFLNFRSTAHRHLHPASSADRRSCLHRCLSPICSRRHLPRNQSTDCSNRLTLLSSINGDLNPRAVMCLPCMHSSPCPPPPPAAATDCCERSRPLDTVLRRELLSPRPFVCSVSRVRGSRLRLQRPFSALISCQYYQTYAIRQAGPSCAPPGVAAGEHPPQPPPLRRRRRLVARFLGPVARHRSPFKHGSTTRLGALRIAYQ